MAQEKWRDMVAQCRFAPQDADNLAAYCAAFARFRSAEEWLRDPEHGYIMTIADDKGNVKTHGVVPQVMMSERAAKEMSRLAKTLHLERKMKAAAAAARRQDGQA